MFYFFTDGDPTEGAIQSAANMTSYLTNSGLGALINALDVEVHAFGVGSVTAGGITILDVIDNTDASPINIVDFEDLESALLGTVGDLNAVTGKVLLGSNNVVGGGDDDSFGADGGRILSIEIDGIVLYLRCGRGRDQQRRQRDRRQRLGARGRHRAWWRVHVQLRRHRCGRMGVHATGVAPGR